MTQTFNLTSLLCRFEQNAVRLHSDLICVRIHSSAEIFEGVLYLFVLAFGFVFSVLLCHLGYYLCFDLFLINRIQNKLPQCLFVLSLIVLLSPPREPPSLSLLHLLASFSEAGELLLHVFCFLMFKLVFLSLELSGVRPITAYDLLTLSREFVWFASSSFGSGPNKGNGHVLQVKLHHGLTPRSTDQ